MMKYCKISATAWAMAWSVAVGTLLWSVPSKASDELIPLDFRQVKVGGDFQRRIDMIRTNNLTKVDLEKNFLSRLRKKESKPGAYLGIGKFMTGTTRMAAYSGDKDILALRQHIFDEVLKTQEPNGYIGAFPPQDRIWQLWDCHETGYILLALCTDYKLFNDERSLAAARKLGDFVVSHWKDKPASWAPFGHSESEALTTYYLNFLELYKTTKDQRYLDFINKELKAPEWNIPIQIGRRPGICGHAYHYMAHCMSQLELYRLNPDQKLLGQSMRCVDFMTKGNGVSIVGGIGQDECWTDDQDGRSAHGETCTSFYEAMFFNSLLRMKGDSHYGDLMERVLYNTLFAAPSPDGRWMRYYNNFEGKNRYQLNWDIYCCPNNMRRFFTHLPEWIYYRAGNGLAVNLFTPSQTTIKMDDGLSVDVKQETDYPTTGHVVLHVDPSTAKAFPVLLRIPSWCQKAEVAINGQPAGVTPQAGKFLRLERNWKSGDVVTLDMDMPFRLINGRRRQSGRVAIMRGPVVYTLNPMQSSKFEDQDAASRGQNAGEVLKARAPKIVEMEAADLSRLRLDVTSLKLLKDDSVRPGGTACRAKFLFSIPNGPGYAYTLKLTEFPDENARCIYFRPNYHTSKGADVGETDELFGGN